MLHRLSPALVVALLVILYAAPPATAQVVRFETTVGSFDMVLNPTDDALLQTHVDNMLDYVDAQSYKSSWINRAPEGFVLQMGSFFAHTKRPVLTLDSVRSVVSFDPVIGQPAAKIGLSNTVGTVALAIPGGNQDGGSSSFFINLGDNSGSLDTDFTVFAAIPDMTVIDEIMSLMQVDIRDELGTDPNNVHFQDIPLTADGKQVFIDRAFVVTDSLDIARARAGVQSVTSASMAAAGGDGGSAALSMPLSTSVVPEPASGLLAVLVLATLVGGRRR
jgi:MYXO-CTERM domain-containing protein